MKTVIFRDVKYGVVAIYRLLEGTTLFPGVKRPRHEVAFSAEVESKWNSTTMAYTGETLYVCLYFR